MADSRAGDVGANRFKIVSELETSDIKEEPFTDAVVTNAEVFSVSKLDHESLFAVAKSIRQDLCENTVTSVTAAHIVLLAHHLQRPDNKLLFVEAKTWEGVDSGDIKMVNRKTTQALDDPNISVNDNPPDELIGADDLFENEDDAEIENEGFLQEEDHPAPAQPFRPVFVDTDPKQLVTYMCFMSAYALRLLTKQSTNMEKSWEHMNDKFIGFYRTMAPQKLRIPASSWSTLKTYLCATRKYQVTWVQLIALTEDVLSPNSDEIGMLKYLGILVFSYSGMHAYSLYCNLVHMTGVKYDDLLNYMDCTKTKKTCNQVFDILIKYGLKSSTERQYFKYGRLFGPQYFMSLQTKACPLFVFLAVSILRHYTSHSAEQDPGNIVGLDTISASNKAFLKGMADSIAKAIDNDESQITNPHCKAGMAAAEAYAAEGGRIGATTLFSGP